MGKSNRIRSFRETERSKVLGVKNKQKGMPSWALSLIAAVMAAVVLLTSAGILLSANGVFGRLMPVVKTEDYKISANMLAYFYSSQYQNFYGSYGSYGIFSFNKDIPHGEQKFGGDNANDNMLIAEGEEKPETWRDYFMNLAVERAKSVLVYCEAAEDYNVSIEEADREEINASIKQLADEGKEAGYSLNNVLAMYFGEGVSEYDVRKAMEYEILASKVATAMGEKIEGEITKEDVNAAYDKDEKKFDVIDYTYYTFKVNYSDIVKQEGFTDDDLTAAKDPDGSKAAKVLAAYQAAIKEARDAAAKLQENATLEDFQQAIYKIVAEKTYDDQFEKNKPTDADKTIKAPAPAEGGETATAAEGDTAAETVKITDDELKAYRDKIIAQVLTEVKEDKSETVKLGKVEGEATHGTYDGKEGVTKEFINKLNKVQEEVFNAVDGATTTYNVEKAKYSEGDKFSEWAYDDGRVALDKTVYHQYDGAKTGDDAKIGDEGKVEDLTTVKATDKYAYISVYMLTKTHAKDEQKSQNFSYIVFSKEEDAKAAAEVLKTLNTKDAFVAKGEEYKTEGKATLVNSVENYEKGGMGSDSIDNWLYDTATADNSVSGVEKITQDSNSVYVVAFRETAGEALWYLDVKASVFSERSEEADKALKDRFDPKLDEFFVKFVKVIGD